MPLIFHCTPRQDWEASAQGPYSAPSLQTHGFIHFSTAEQILSIANTLFRGQAGLVLLCVNPKRLAPEVRFENLDGGTTLYPHVYGPVNPDAVTRVLDFPPEPDGTFRLPPLALTDYFSHDPEYRRRRQLGRPGWDEAAFLPQTLTAIDNFLADVHLPAPATILEFGCGAGDLLLPWAQRGHRVAGIDISPFAIDWAREKFAAAGLHADFFVADLTRDLPLSLPPADLLLDGHCLHCLIGADRQSFFRNALRCLKPAALLHINSMCNDPHPINLAAPSTFDPFHRCIIVGGIATRYFGRAPDILHEITAAGFHLEKHTVIPAQYEGDEDCLLANALAPSLESRLQAV